MNDLQEQLTDHLRRRAAAVRPRLDLEAVERGRGSASVVHGEDGPRDRRHDEIVVVRHADRPTRRPLVTALVGVAAATLVGVAVAGTLTRDGRPTAVTSPPVDTTVTSTAVEATSPAFPGTDAMWPQSSLDQVRAAQALADAGDPSVAWQVDSQLASDDSWTYLRQWGGGPQIVERFLRDELGWEGFLFNAYQGDDGDGAADGVHRGLVYLRCAPGTANTLYPSGPDSQQEAPGAELCAPTIDEFRYETVHLDLAQLADRGSTGIWVVSRWTEATPFAQTDPRVAESEATTSLEEFLRARVEGQGAEGRVELAGETFAVLDEVPLLYTTSAGIPYQRYEIDRLSGPQWPFGWMDFRARLFTEADETVVEQSIYLLSDADGQLKLWLRAAETTENGQPVDISYGFFDGEVTATAPEPWRLSPFVAVALTLNGQLGDERFELVADPFPVATGCERGPTTSDASSLAASLQSDPDLQVTAPVAVTVGGAEGLSMDITLAAGASVCELVPSTQVLTQNDSHRGPGPPGVNLDEGSRMRLLLLDLPDGGATRVLAIAVVAPEARFDAVVASATPIIESIEFHTD